MKPNNIRFLLFLGLFLALAAIASGWVWLYARPQPKPTTRQLYQGVQYQREVRQSPRPQVIHIVTIDMRTPGLRFLVTPGDPDQQLSSKARTTTRFLTDFDLQVAVNGDGFTPWHSNTIFDYYPHAGDPVEPVGFAASQGIPYATASDAEPVLYISRTNQARFNIPTARIYNAISGNLMLVEQGQVLPGLDESRQPRTAIGLDKAARRLIIVVVDGRQPGYSEGASLGELAEILLAHNVYNAMNLDGGGSSTLAVQDAFGGAALLNAPITNGIPGFQRPVANHLGIFAPR